MANELKHDSVGTELTQAEWEAVGTHVVANQAIGDIIYADTTSQLLRLGVGATNDVLRVTGGKPDWQATSFITSLGTIATGVWQGTDVGVAYGGTGVSTLTDGGVLLGSGASAVTAMAVLTDGQMIVGNGTTDPVAESGATLRTSIGVGTGDSPSFTALTLDGDLDFTGPQAITTTSGDLTLNPTGNVILDGSLDVGDHIAVGGSASVQNDIVLEINEALGEVDSSSWGQRVIVNVHETDAHTGNLLTGIESSPQISASNNKNWTASTAVRAFETDIQFAGGSGTIEGIAHYYVKNATVSGVTVSNQYGIRIESLTTATTNYAIYTAGTAQSSFGGNVAIGGVLDMTDGAINNIGTSGFNITSAGLVDVAGESGSFWNADRIAIEGDESSRVKRTSSNTNALQNCWLIYATSDANVTDGFGPAIMFVLEDDAVDNSVVGRLGFRRAGADNTGDFVLSTYVSGSENEAFKVDSTGIGYFDASGAGTAVPTLFDAHDDALVLRDGISLGMREELERIGVMQRKDSGSGWYLKMQPFAYLLAGGVYQNRARIDAQYDELNRRLIAIGG